MTNAIQVPCKNCPDRKLHCHTTCKKYIDYKKEIEASNARERLEKAIYNH
jgi:hypothetical protein